MGIAPHANFVPAIKNGDTSPSIQQQCVPGMKNAPRLARLPTSASGRSQAKVDESNTKEPLTRFVSSDFDHCHSLRGSIASERSNRTGDLKLSLCFRLTSKAGGLFFTCSTPSILFTSAHSPLIVFGAVQRRCISPVESGMKVWRVFGLVSLRPGSVARWVCFWEVCWQVRNVATSMRLTNNFPQPSINTSRNVRSKTVRIRCRRIGSWSCVALSPTLICWQD